MILRSQKRQRVKHCINCRFCLLSLAIKITNTIKKIISSFMEKVFMDLHTESAEKLDENAFIVIYYT